MSSVLSSLFGGTTPPSTTTYGQNLSNVPSWLLNSENSLVQQANSVASQPYQQYSGPQVAPWTPDQTAAQGITQQLQGQYQPAINSAEQMAGQSSNPGALQTATGYLPQATSDIQNALAPSQAQMNPYINNVIQNAQLQSSQYFQNSLQPQINAQFTAGGNYGSAANQNAQQLAANQLTENLNSQSSAALAGAYSNAQQAGLAGGQALGTLAQTQGGLGYEQGILGLQGAGTLGTLASTGQNLGLQGAGQLYNVGQAQQTQGQQNLTTAYNNFENQTYYPQNQLSWLQGALTGAPANTGTASQTTNAGYLPTAQYGASPINQAVGIYSGLNSLGQTTPS
jgi:hypothetical protein